jgi:hypothetical protein
VRASTASTRIRTKTAGRGGGARRLRTEEEQQQQQQGMKKLGLQPKQQLSNPSHLRVTPPLRNLQLSSQRPDLRPHPSPELRYILLSLHLQHIDPIPTLRSSRRLRKRISPPSTCSQMPPRCRRKIPSISSLHSRLRVPIRAWRVLLRPIRRTVRAMRAWPECRQVRASPGVCPA